MTFLQTNHPPLKSGPSSSPRSGNTCCGYHAGAAAGSSKFRPRMPFASMVGRPSGTPSVSACWTTPASSAPGGTKRTAAGHPMMRLDHPPPTCVDGLEASSEPLSGGARKALKKELRKAHAMTTILAAQSREARKGRCPDKAGRPTSRRKLERENVGGWRANRSVAVRRPGGQWRPWLASDRMLALQDGARHRSRRPRPPADDVHSRLSQSASVSEMRQDWPPAGRHAATTRAARPLSPAPGLNPCATCTR